MCKKKHASTLRLSREANLTLVKAVMKSASPDLVKSICECYLNVLKGHLPLTSTQMSRLRRHKQSLRDLVNKDFYKKKEENNTKRRIFRSSADSGFGSLGWLVRKSVKWNTRKK